MVHVDSQNTNDHVEDLWRNLKQDEYHKVLTSVQESTYKRQPLGRSCIRGHKLPQYMNDDTYRHGVKTCERNEDAKRLLYPLGTSSVENSHNLHKPGEQKRRNYNWPVDPTTTTFGVKGEVGTGRGGSAGVALALQMNHDGIEERKPTVDVDKVFGKSTCQGIDSAADCLGHTGDNDTKEDRDADDLGKSLTPGFRNVETSRSFGCPSIRTDIPKYERSSVADFQNYGDDCNAAYLLRPSLLSSLGLEDDEFERPRSKESLRKLVMNCGLVANEDEFDCIFRQVADAGKASIEGFLSKVERR
jgi:hypothetical protein